MYFCSPMVLGWLHSFEIAAAEKFPCLVDKIFFRKCGCREVSLLRGQNGLIVHQPGQVWSCCSIFYSLEMNKFGRTMNNEKKNKKNKIKHCFFNKVRKICENVWMFKLLAPFLKGVLKLVCHHFWPHGTGCSKSLGHILRPQFSKTIMRNANFKTYLKELTRNIILIKLDLIYDTSTHTPTHYRGLAASAMRKIKR